ncbi:MAG: neutral/alkaline non-lysosomal ceramidase N-terminal domain-containing protein [Deltaproteobacteria bacterium]|nr:neutral/alkaline non-lysosomal ceramidase N-terminal domain-containing protein [Deltaproteobacteria bacterium]
MRAHMLRLRALAACLGLLLAACGGEDGAAPAPVPLPPRPEPPPAGPFQAGFAEVVLPVPLGIGTMGYGGLGKVESVTPFAVSYPGTTRQHGALTARAVALSRGPAHEVVLVRTDTVGIFQHLREAVLAELQQRTGRDWDDALIIAGNHTHSGPGRMILAQGMLTLLADSFFPEFYDRIVDALADVVEQALGDLAPAELGWTKAACHEAHHDRRCENDHLDQVQELPDLPVVAVRRGGKLAALVMSYAYHGTVLGIEDLTLSGDMGAAAEQKIAERLDHPVQVLLFNAWGADMSPGDPTIDPAAAGAEQPAGYDKMQGLGVRIADAVLPQLEAIQYTAEPELRAETHRASINRELLGYDEETFPYPNGAVYCGVSNGNCDDATPVEGLDQGCVQFSPEEPAPDQTLFTAGWIGGLSFVTGPGEWSTALAGGVLDQLRALRGGEAMFLGYANDYMGYSIGERDWWQGGYETGGALWGPKQGDYLAARAFDTFRYVHDLAFYLPFAEPPPVKPFSGYEYDPYAPEDAVEAGTVSEDVPETVAPTDVVRFVARGSDPWLGLPVATLEQESEGSFAPVRRANQSVVDSTSYDFWIDLAVDPPYSQLMPAKERSFFWTFNFPASRRAASTIPKPAGKLRFSVRIPTGDPGGEAVAQTASFEVK